MIEHYERRAAAHAGSREVETRLSIRISRLRLATFLPGAVCLVWSMAGSGPWLLAAAGVGLIGVFAALVVWHAWVDERAAWYDALHAVNLQALARIGRAWDRLPPAEPTCAADRRSLPGGWDGGPDTTISHTVAGKPRLLQTDLEHHPYAVDLDLFGRASLMQWLGPAATAGGTLTLHSWLLGPAARSDITARQLAVVELAPAVEWREFLGAHGRVTAGVRQVELERFLAWAESPGAFSGRGTRLLRMAAAALTVAIWTLMALHATGMIASALWLIPIAAGMILSFATSRQIHGQFDRAGAGQQAFARYAALFAHAAGAPARAPLLGEIRARLAAPGSAAPECLRRLSRIIGFAQLRSGAAILHFPVQALTLWDVHVFVALDSWRSRVGPAVRGWMRALGELDALSAFAQARIDNPAWCMPEITDGPVVFEARNLGHPLIADDRRVGNDVAVGPPGTLLLITGSNMSGKSTLLRAIGLNAVLAQAGAPVCAASLRLPPIELETSIRVQDSLELGLSYFMAALARLKGIVDRSQHPHREGRTVMYLLDEILQGTNTAERAIAVRGVARHLLNAGAIGVMTSHDLGIAAEEPLNVAARLVHFSETVDDHGVMSFDYRLRPGLATSRNALRLMRLIGLDLEQSG